MIDLTTELVAALKTVNANVVYELFLDSKTNVPCISQIEDDNRDIYVGDTIGYSDVAFLIKVQEKSENKSNQISICQGIDNKLRSIGYSRVSSSDMTSNNLICKILRYECLAQETYPIPTLTEENNE